MNAVAKKKIENRVAPVEYRLEAFRLKIFTRAELHMVFAKPRKNAVVAFVAAIIQNVGDTNAVHI